MTTFRNNNFPMLIKDCIDKEPEYRITQLVASNPNEEQLLHSIALLLKEIKNVDRITENIDWWIKQIQNDK